MNTTHLILDRSGSMQTHWSDTIGAVNAYFATIGTEVPGAKVAVTMFDSEGIDTLRDCDVAAYTPVGVQEVAPRGGTPLLDAVGRVITTMKAVPLGADDRRSVVVMTDGEENASREWSMAKLKDLIEEVKAAGWIVIFLGADLAAWSQGAQMGTSALNSMQYASATPDFAMTAVAQANVRYMTAPTRSAGITHSTFTDEERQMAMGETPPAVATQTVVTTSPPPATPGYGEKKW